MDAEQKPDEPRSTYVVLGLIVLLYIVGIIYLGEFFAAYLAGAAVGWGMCSQSLGADWRWWREKEARLGR